MPDRLRALARAVADRSHAPYSGVGAGAAVLLADGRWVAAPRLEAASFPLTVPALQGALALAALAGGAGHGAGRALAVAVTAAMTAADVAAVGQALGGKWRPDAPDLAVAVGAEVPEVGQAVSFEVAPAPAASREEGVARAVEAAARAVVPASDFRVGAVVEDDAGRRVAGANVEVAGDWTRGLCAERTALVAARAAGLGPVRRLSVACVGAPGGTPCGGCRQVIAELAADAEVVIWRGADAPETTTPAALLPGAFRGDALGR